MGVGWGITHVAAAAHDRTVESCVEAWQRLCGPDFRSHFRLFIDDALYEFCCRAGANDILLRERDHAAMFCKMNRLLLDIG
jgi:hypothetical protein